MSINTAALSGRLTRDPELRQTQSGTSVANTAVAVEHYKKDAENETSFVDLVIWGNFADLVAAKARKGDTVTVQGELKQSTWEAQDGSKRSKIELHVREMVGEFLYRKADGSDTPARSDGEQQQIAPGAASEKAVADPANDDIPF